MQALNTQLISLKRKMPKTKKEIVKAIWWLCSTTTIFLFTCYCIYEILRKSEGTSTVLTLSGKSKSITHVPFPKVTFCPRGYYKIHDLHSTPNNNDNTKKDNSHLNRSQTISEIKQILFRTCELKDNVTSSDMVELDFIEILEKVSLSSENVLFNCHFGENPLDHDLEMRKRITEHGICFSFNAVPLDLLYKDTNIEPLPKRTGKNRQFPHYPKGFDDRGRFELGIAIPKSWKLSLGCSQQQFAQVSVTNPYDMTTTDFTDSIMGPGEEIYMEYKVGAFVSTEEALRHFPEKRNCLYENENHLRFFKTYNEFNCNLECLSNYTMEKCGCVDFFMPREKSQKVCASKELKCVAQAKLQIHLESDPSISNRRCNCKSNCEATSYKTSIFRSVIVNTYFNKSIEKDYHIYCLTVFTNSRAVLPYIRQHIFTLTDYVANLGGLIALLTGVSVSLFTSFRRNVRNFGTVLLRNEAFAFNDEFCYNDIRESRLLYGIVKLIVAETRSISKETNIVNKNGTKIERIFIDEKLAKCGCISDESACYDVGWDRKHSDLLILILMTKKNMVKYCENDCPA